MLDILREYLNGATTPEETNHIAVADRVLTRAQDENYEHVIEEILMTDQDADAGTTVPTIVAVYRNQLYQFFSNHSFVVVDTLNLQEMAELANGILDLAEIENPETLFALSDEEAPTVEKVCTMLTQTTRYSADELLHMVENVADGFLTRMREINRVPDADDEGEHVNRRERLHAYRKYMIYLESLGVVMPSIDDIVRSGGGPAMPYLFYAQMLDKLKPLESLPPREVARELFGAAVVSDNGFGHPSESIKQSLEQFVSDPKVVSSIMVEVRNILMGYQS